MIAFDLRKLRSCANHFPSKHLLQFLFKTAVMNIYLKVIFIVERFLQQYTVVIPYILEI